MRTYRLANSTVRLNCLQDIKTLPENWIVKISEPKRSISQNDYFWTLADILGKHFGYSKAAIKDMLMIRLGFYREKEVDGKIYTIVDTTTELKKEEFSKLIDGCLIMGNSDNVTLPLASFYGVE